MNPVGTRMTDEEWKRLTESAAYAAERELYNKLTHRHSEKIARKYNQLEEHEEKRHRARMDAIHEQRKKAKEALAEVNVERENEGITRAAIACGIWEQPK